MFAFTSWVCQSEFHSTGAAHKLCSVFFNQ